MRFEWNEAKNGRNLLKHDVGFETAVLVFDDPYAFDAARRIIRRGTTLDHSGRDQPGRGPGCRSHLVRERGRGDHSHHFSAGRRIA
jgi:hypothetical protein